MEPGGSIPYSHGLYNNTYSEPNQPDSSYWLIPFSLRSIETFSSHLRLGLPKAGGLNRVIYNDDDDGDHALEKFGNSSEAK